MTQRMMPEIKAMRAVARAFEAISKADRFRLLAYFTAREQGLGTSLESKALYALAHFHEKKRRTPRAKEK